MKKRKDKLPILSAKTLKIWQKWIAKNHAKSSGIWLRFFKKRSQKEYLTYAQALDVALCYGWIDGQALGYDEESWLQKFTKRRPRSGWSKRNTKHAHRLIRAGKMRRAGLVEIRAAKKDGRWKAAYDSPSQSKVPSDFLRELNKNKRAKEFFKTLNRANLYAIAYRLQTAKKPETRERRKKLILAMMAKGQKFH